MCKITWQRTAAVEEGIRPHASILVVKVDNGTCRATIHSAHDRPEIFKCVAGAMLTSAYVRVWLTQDLSVCTVYSASTKALATAFVLRVDERIKEWTVLLC